MKHCGRLDGEPQAPGEPTGGALRPTAMDNHSHDARRRLRCAGALVGAAIALTACAAGGGTSTVAVGPASSPSTQSPTPIPTLAPSKSSVPTGGIDCASGTVTLTYHQQEFAVPHVCVRVGAVLNVVVAPVAPAKGAPMSGPRSSDPSRVVVTSGALDRDGTARAALKATAPGSATVTWGPGGTVTFTLRLDVVPASNG